MAYPNGPAPTLGEFIEKAEAYGAEVRHTAFVQAPTGPISFSYLWINDARFVELPEISYGAPLGPGKVVQMARRLQLDADIFWPGIQGFVNDDPPD